MIRYDIRGYGKSALPDSNEVYRDSDDLNALMDFLGIKKAPHEIQQVFSKELIDILSTINPLDKVIIMTSTEQSLHLLTTVLKCSEECHSVHLLSGYMNDVYNAN